MPARFSRRLLLGTAAATPAAGLLSVPTATARPTDLSSELLDEWAKAPGDAPAHPRHLPRRLPRRQAPAPPARRRERHGLRRSPRRRHSAAAFNAAVRYAGERGGGTVVVPRGDLPPRLPTVDSLVERRPARRRPDRTILHFTKPLEESYRPNLQPSLQSRWSWTGGQIWVIARSARPNPRPRTTPPPKAGCSARPWPRSVPLRVGSARCSSTDRTPRGRRPRRTRNGQSGGRRRTAAPDR